MQSIEDIRGKKAEIAQALRELGVGKPQENEVRNILFLNWKFEFSSL